MTELRQMRVLLVEDNPGDARLVQLALASETSFKFVTVLAENLAEAKAQLEQGGFDAVLLDLSLPDSFGMNTVRSVMKAAPAVPIVVLTGLDDSKVGYEAVKEGAQDYLVKGHADGDQLRRAILYSEYRKSSQMTIERLHRRNDAILNALGEGVLGLDGDGKVIFLNPEILRMTEQPAELIMGRLPHEALEEIDLDGRRIVFASSAIADTLADGAVRHVSDVFLARPDGSRVPVDYIVTPMSLGGRIEGAVVAYRDVSDRQQAFDVLRRQLTFHQKLIDALPLPMFYLDVEFVILGCNAAFERLVDRSAMSLLGQLAFGALPEPISRAIEDAAPGLSEATPCVVELVMPDMSRTALAVSPIIDGAGAVLGYAATLSSR